MHIIFSKGGLGNQIFQYSYVISNLTNKKVIFIGFEDLDSLFDLEHKFYLSNKKFITKIIKRIILGVIKFFESVRVVSTLKAVRKNNIELCEVNLIVRLIKNIIFTYDSYFQSEIFFNKSLKDKLKIKYKLKSKIILNKESVFIHIRKGDFDKYRVLGQSTILPDLYYIKSIKEMERHIKNPKYYVFSDTKQDFNSIFQGRKYINLSNLNFKETFLLMTKFENAIISASTFSWWGTYLMKKKGIIIVPENWLGFNSKIDYPEKPFTNYMKKISFK